MAMKLVRFLNNVGVDCNVIRTSWTLLVVICYINR
jgi:hypothetical protein